MANQWLRLWHDMPNDPKWRTIARISCQPISLVKAAYLHLLVDASQNVTRGHATVTHEDLASALDVTEDAISAVLEAMQHRVLDGMRLLGWEIRQPKREEYASGESTAKSPAERKAEQRQREKLAKENKNITQSHGESRNVTTDKDKEEDKENKETTPIPPEGGDKPKSKKSPIGLPAYLADCKATGTQAIPEGHSVFDYAGSAKIPDDFLRLQWLEFRDRYSEEGATRYKAWPTVFGKSVRGNWFKLWYFDKDGACVLTTTGIQAKNTHEAKK